LKKNTKSLNNAREQEKKAEIKVVELKKEIEFFKSNIEDLKKKIEKIEETKKQMIYLSELEDWISKNFLQLISKIEKSVMIKLKSDFSVLFSEWFSMLVPDSFNLSLDDEFTPIIEYQDYEID
jgi:predicted  nucleic acid-binding Zn-ribbon protein